MRIAIHMGMVGTRITKSALCLSLMAGPPHAFGGQYQQQCDQASQQAQQQCQGATMGANAADLGQATSLGNTVGASASQNPAALGMMSQAMGQMTRMSGAAGQCEQAKSQCEQQCSQQKQQAQQDKKAQQQGEPQQVDQSKQQNCSQKLDSMIAPLLAAAAMALAALMAAKKSGEQSQSNPPVQTASLNPANPITAQLPSSAQSKASTAPQLKLGKAMYNEPAVQKTIAAIERNGGQVTEKGVVLKGGALKEWGSLVSGGGSAGTLPGGAGEAARAPAGVATEYGGNAARMVSGSSASADMESTGTVSGESPDSDYEFGTKKIKPFSVNAKSAAGFTTNLDGQPIGVKGENIFEMVHRAYGRKQSSFIETP